jgi:peroxiredoxin
MRRVSAILAALLLAACEGERGPAPALAVGKPAPSYAATTLTGDTVALADLRGKVVLLNVWATWCHPCRTEIPALQRLHERNRERGLEVVGVSVDARGEDAAVRAFAGEFGMTFPIWRDPSERVSTMFQAIGVPSTYLIGRDGTLRWRHLGPVRENDRALRQALDRALAE